MHSARINARRILAGAHSMPPARTATGRWSAVDESQVLISYGDGPILVASQRRADRTAGHSRRADYLPGDDFRGDAFFVDFVAGFFAVGATFFEVAFFFTAGRSEE